MRFAVLGGLLALFVAAPFAGWRPGQGFRLSAPRVVAGDEPHYLMIVNSLLFDRDLSLADDYRRVQRGGSQAGAAHRGEELDHHTILIDSSGAHELWQRVFDWRHHQAGGGFARFEPGFEGALEVPAHPPAFPALIALLLAPIQPAPERVEAWAILLSALFGFGALAAAFFAALRAGFAEREALAAIVLAGLASPLLPYSKSFFTEPSIACALSLALWAWLARRPALCGFFCFAAAAIKPPFGLVALGWAASRRTPELRPLLSTFFLCCAGLAVFNLQLAHTPLISGTAGFVPASGPGGFGEMLLGDKHGLLAYAPWAAAGLFVAARAAIRGDPGLLRDLAWGAAPVLAVFAISDVEAGGFCYGPRYFVPFLPWLALATVAAWRDARTRWRALIAALAITGFAIAIPGALRYGDLFDRPVIAAFRR